MKRKQYIVTALQVLMGKPLKVFRYGGLVKNLRGLAPAKVTTWWVSGLLIVILFSCSLKDTRDICCDDIVIDFRYSKGSADVFKDHIQTIRHYIFSESGLLVDVILQPANLQQIKPTNLPNGKYTIVSIGNMSNKTILDNMIVGSSTLSQMNLYVNTLMSNGFMGNTDKLYYGNRTFERKIGTYTRYISDMSNVHCVLTVTVRWKNNKIPGAGNYIMQLKGVSKQYDLRLRTANPLIVVYDNTVPPVSNTYESTINRVVHGFPVNSVTPLFINHGIEVPMLSGEVKGQFITLRYMENQIPSFQLFKDNLAVMKEIDLTKFFQKMGWILNNNLEQKFDILIEIDPDTGIITVSDINGEILDWIDGGEISN